MDDQDIVRLFLERDERALQQTALKYGAYCTEVAYRILENRQDAEECVNDAYLRTWNAIPPQSPRSLRSFLAKITRNVALNRYRDDRTLRRGQGEVCLALDELGECVSGEDNVPEAYLREEMGAYINRFLRQLPRRDCDIFLSRYYFLYSACEIADRQGVAEAYVRTNLSRTRRKLRQYLERNGLL